MCEFFSFVTDPEHQAGKRFYFDKHERAKKRASGVDSHSSICRHFGLREDLCNKYEYDVEEQKFRVDQINSPVNDSLQAEDWVRQLDFNKKIIPANKWGIKLGDKLGFRPLREIRRDNSHNRITCGWNDYMDYLCKERVKVIVTANILMRLGKGEERYVAEIPDGSGHRSQNWKISVDMLKMPELKK